MRHAMSPRETITAAATAHRGDRQAWRPEEGAFTASPWEGLHWEPLPSDEPDEEAPAPHPNMSEPRIDRNGRQVLENAQSHPWWLDWYHRGGWIPTEEWPSVARYQRQCA